MNKQSHQVRTNDIHINDNFWEPKLEIAAKVAIPYMWNALNDSIPDIPPSNCIKNFKIAAGLETGEFKGYVFQDSDLYKWLEAVGFYLCNHKDEKLEKIADDAIALIGKAQLEDGYINTHFMLSNGAKRWTDLKYGHEMYCAGHMMEAAAAYFEGTGKRALLDIACKFADHIDSLFGEEENKLKGYPGHQEIEVGLAKLYKATGEKRYIKLAKYFLDERGKQPFYYDIEVQKRGENIHVWNRTHGTMPYSYNQAHLPVREQKVAVGHAVRAGYMYAAMADVAAITNDESLLDAARVLWNDVTLKQMYITGGIGSMGDGEAFSFDYDLPNDRMYNETCAAIALMMFAQRMLQIEHNSKYADVLELALYNCVLSGMQMDGTKYFYVNPMEVWPERSEKRNDMMDVASARQGWFSCACCPPNILRTITGLGQYIYSQLENQIYVNLFISSKVSFDINGERITMEQKGNFPWECNVDFIMSMEHDTNIDLAIRIPNWSTESVLTFNNEQIDLSKCVVDGYAHIKTTFKNGDILNLNCIMKAQKVKCNSRVPFNAGKVAVKRGPLVYCLEQTDNYENLWNVVLPKSSQLEAEFKPELLNGVTTITTEGIYQSFKNKNDLYFTEDEIEEKIKLKFVPYYSWCNREPGEMMVWIREK